jgi:hypothetical protein
MDESARSDLTHARKARPYIASAQRKGANTSEIARYLSRSRTWVTDVLAWDGTGTLYGKDTERRQLDAAKQVLRESSEEEIHTLVAGLPHDTKRKIERAVEREQNIELVKVSPNPLGVEVKIAQKVSRARVLLHEARELCGSVDRPGDDEDIIDDLDLLAREVQATKEAYISGESIDTELSRILN